MILGFFLKVGKFVIDIGWVRIIFEVGKIYLCILVSRRLLRDRGEREKKGLLFFGG